MELLKFSTDNTKLKGQGILAFNLPAGHSCPGARACRTFACPDTGKITDAPGQEHRCYAASMEAAFPALRRAVWHNFMLLTEAATEERITSLIMASLPRGWRGMRVHSDGDFFSLPYFRAWLGVARAHERMFFYAYTKSVNFWVLERARGNIPPNMLFTASRGGRYDHLIDEHKLKEAVVVKHPEEAEALGLRIDHDDSLARDARVSKFALLLHGMQPAGSEASAALKRMRGEGIHYSYTRK